MIAHGEGSRIVPARDLVAALGGWGEPIPATVAPVLAPGFPDLPDMVSGMDAGAVVPPALMNRLREGCYAAEFLPLRTAGFAWPRTRGTLRVEFLGPGRLVASGDLYGAEGAPGEPDLAAPVGGDGEPGASPIPIYPRSRYHAYLRLDAEAAPGTARLRGAARVVLGCSWHRIRSIEFNVWNPSEWTTWRWREPEADHAADDSGLSADPRDPVVFEVFDEVGLVVGEMRLRWLSPYFRSAVVEIDTEGDLPPPVEDGAGESWMTVFERVGWRVAVETGRLEGALPATGRWTYAELHEAMLRSRSDADLDGVWRYHVSVVRYFSENPSPLGIAFDHEASDRNGVPREGVAVQAGAALPAEPRYGPYAGHEIRQHPDLLLHIAIHEIGHAMGLYHNHVGCGVMDQISGLAARAGAGGLKAGTLVPFFQPDDVVRLRHLPDIYVRPGGTDWETQGVVEDHDEAFGPIAGLFRTRDRAEAEGALELVLGVVGERIPAGAPVRLDFELRNRSGRAVEVPSELGLATPFVRGWVTGPDGIDNEFRSLFKPIASDRLVALAPGQASPGSLTLLRGHRGALFARVGWHEIGVEILWSHAGQSWRVRRRIRVEAVGPSDPAEARAVRRLVRTPETLGYLVLGRARAFEAGEQAIDEALQATELRPHFAFVKARALALAHFGGRVNWPRVRELLDEDRDRLVLNRREQAKAARLREAASGAAPA